MAWVFAQVFLAFALAVFIVWWTIPKKKEPKATSNPAGESTEDSKR